MIKNIVAKYLIRNNRMLRALNWLAYTYYAEPKKEEFRELGKNCIIYPNVFISRKDRLIIKDNVQIHEGTLLSCIGCLHIGNNVGIARDCKVLTSEHEFRKTSVIPYGPTVIAKPVYIDDNVWIGANVCILPGVEIGEGAIIGMGSVVAKDIPPCAIVMGNPAKIIGWRNTDKYEESKREKKFVRHQYYEKIVVPKYIQRRQKRYNLIKPLINGKEIILDE